MVTKERFAQGMTLQEYVDHMSINRERFVEALEETTIEGPETTLLDRMGAVRKVMVISEDWCGTCLAQVPFVAKLIEGKPDVELRLFPRDANPDLMDQYLKQGLYRSIPVFAFFDEHMNEVARFLEQRPG